MANLDSSRDIQQEFSAGDKGQSDLAPMTHWTVVEAGDTYSKAQPYIAKAGEHVKNFGSFVDAKFGSVVIGEHGGETVAEAGATVNVSLGAKADAKPGSRVTVQKEGQIEAGENTEFTIEKGASVSVEKGARAIVKDGAEASLSKGAEATAQSGSRITAYPGSVVYGESGAHIMVQPPYQSISIEPAKVYAPAGADIETKGPFEATIINRGSKASIPEADSSGGYRSKFFDAEPESKVELGAFNMLRAQAGSEVLAKADSTVLAESGSKVKAQDGSIVFAKPGAQVDAEPGAVVASADETVHFDSLIQERTAQHIVDSAEITKNMHLVGDGETARTANDIIVNYTNRSADVTVRDPKTRYIGDLVQATVEAGTNIVAQDGSIVVARDGSHVAALEGSHVTAQKGSNVVAEAGAWVTAEAGSCVDGKNGSHIEAAAGSNVLRHVETDLRAETGANLTWKPTLEQRLIYETEKFAWQIAPYASLLIGARVKDEFRYVPPRSVFYKDHFPEY